MSGLIKKGADIPTVLALHLAWNVGRSWALPGLHNVIFGSGGAALAQTHLFTVAPHNAHNVEIQRSTIQAILAHGEYPQAMTFLGSRGEIAG